MTLEQTVDWSSPDAQLALKRIHTRAAWSARRASALAWVSRSPSLELSPMRGGVALPSIEAAGGSLRCCVGEIF